MSPAVSQLFLKEIMPRITVGVKRMRVSQREDRRELCQDALALAAANVVQLVRAGKEIQPGTVACFALRRIRSGRRSTGSRHSDVMHPGSACRVDSLDAPLDSADPECGTLYDVLSSLRSGPARLAQQHLDWGEFVPQLQEKQREVLFSTALGRSGKATAQTLKISDPRVAQIKREVARKIRGCWGNDVLSQVQRATTEILIF